MTEKYFFFGEAKMQKKTFVFLACHLFANGPYPESPRSTSSGNCVDLEDDVEYLHAFTRNIELETWIVKTASSLGWYLDFRCISGQSWLRIRNIHNYPRNLRYFLVTMYISWLNKWVWSILLKLPYCAKLSECLTRPWTYFWLERYSGVRMNSTLSLYHSTIGHLVVIFGGSRTFWNRNKLSSKTARQVFHWCCHATNTQSPIVPSF